MSDIAADIELPMNGISTFQVTNSPTLDVECADSDVDATALFS
jgi:hypothetical protein